MLGDWLKLSILSSGSLFGVYFIFGFIMNWLEQINTEMIYKAFGYIGVVITGFIGTVTHEFSHFITCLLFRHQVTEVAWFRPRAAMRDGVLGYVAHSYNPDSLYQRIGNFFIGIAPLLLGSIFILILFHLCLPKAARKYTQDLSVAMRQVSNSFTIGGIIKMMFKQTGQLFSHLFTKENMKKPIFWLFLFAMYSISSHMSLSMADLKGAMVGLIVLLVIVISISFIMVLFQLPVKKCTRLLIKYNAFMISNFSIGISFSILTIAISYIFQMIMP